MYICNEDGEWWDDEPMFRTPQEFQLAMLAQMGLTWDGYWEARLAWLRELEEGR